MKTILITGASSGMGYQTAELLAKAGNKVYGVARHIEKMAPLEALGVTPLVMDVTDQSSINKVVDQIIKETGKIDVLVNAAGYGSFGALENVKTEEAKKQFDVNVFGLMALTQKVLPFMKSQHAGKIINISSMAGRFSAEFGGWYFASKHAVETLSDSLRMEVKRFGIEVVLIEPGVVKSGWSKIAMDHLNDSSKGTDYQKVAEKYADKMNGFYASKLASKPTLIANTIVKVINKKHPRARYLIGFGAKPVIFINNLLPTSWMDKVINKFM